MSLRESCKAEKKCTNCTSTRDTAIHSCDVCLVCTDRERRESDYKQRRDRHGQQVECCRYTTLPPKHDDKDDDDNIGRDECDEVAPEPFKECGRRFLCECRHRPCKDKFDVPTASLPCELARAHELEELGKVHEAHLYQVGERDVFLVTAKERKLTYKFDFELVASPFSIGIQVLQLPQWLDCSKPTNVINSAVFFAPDVAMSTVLLPAPGAYVIIVALTGGNEPPQCIVYKGTASTASPICPDSTHICEQKHCFSDRECGHSSSCDARIGRCIERESKQKWAPHKVDERSLGRRSDGNCDAPCENARDGTLCVLQKNRDDPFTCSRGKCKDHECKVYGGDNTFPCDCVCAPECTCDGECKDGNPQTQDICIEETHQCIHPPYHAKAPTPTPAPTNSTTPTPPTILSAASSGRVAGPLVPSADQTRCLMPILDDAERAFTMSSMDRFGGYELGHYVPPYCDAESLDSRFVSVSLDTRIGNDAHTGVDCCKSTDRRQCVDENASLRTGRQWLDEAWLELDSAHRDAQTGNAGGAIQHACCAMLIYTAVGAACGRPHADSWSTVAVQTEVVRLDEHQDVGPRCLAFDDKHKDRDLNELVLEERRVELRYNSNVIAVNVHTRLLARGSGCVLSYALVTGDGRSDRALIVGEDTASAKCPERQRAMVGIDNEALRAELAQGTPSLAAGSFIAVTRHALSNAGLPSNVAASECTTFGPSGYSYCPRGDVAVLYPTAHSALPLARTDTLEHLQHRAPEFREPTANTQRYTRRVRALYSTSAVVIMPYRSSVGNDAIHSLLRNHDCATSVRLGSRYDEATPLAIAVPASVCVGWRWAAEGAMLIARPDSTARMCRGGDDSGVVECSNAQCAEGGICAASPSEGGVAYPYAWLYYECVARGVRCDDKAPHRDEQCCDERVRRWYAHGNNELLYEE